LKLGQTKYPRRASCNAQQLKKNVKSFADDAETSNGHPWSVLAGRSEELDMLRQQKINVHSEWVLIACTTLFFGLGACSSSVKSEGDAAMSEEIPDLDAGTDAVPIGELEQIEGSLDTAAVASSDGLTPPPETAPSEAPVAVTDPLAAPATTDTAMTNPDVVAPSEPASNEVAPETQNNSWSGGSDSYQVQAGDTLMKIAFETYGDLYQWKKIFEWNRDKISDPNAVPPGVSLKLEKPSSPIAIDRNGDKYLIKVGDTLGTISDDLYGTKAKWRKLWENNRQLIKDPNRIFAGFYLYYTMTPDEQNESDQLKQQRNATPPPLAGAPMDAAPPVADERSPAAVTGG